MRASHADRDQVVDALKAAFVAGMLAKDELELRVDEALSSRTCAELADITADLPDGLAGEQPPNLAEVGAGQPVVQPGQLPKGRTPGPGGLAFPRLRLRLRVPVHPTAMEHGA